MLVVVMSGVLASGQGGVVFARELDAGHGALDRVAGGFHPRRKLQGPAKFQQGFVDVEAGGVRGDFEQDPARFTEVDGSEVSAGPGSRSRRSRVSASAAAPELLVAVSGTRKAMWWTVPPATRPEGPLGSATTSTILPAPPSPASSRVRSAVSPVMRSPRVLGQHAQGAFGVFDGEHRGVLAADGVFGRDRGGVPRVAGVGGGGGDQVQLQAVRVPEREAFLVR